MTLSVNRVLKDKFMNRIDHALGRPVNPLAATYREYFAAGKDSQIAADMAASPHWEAGAVKGDLHWFYVSRAGREALHAHLRAIGDQHRVYAVIWDGIEMQCVATSSSKARYKKWIELSDSYDISFREFCRTARVRLAVGGEI